MCIYMYIYICILYIYYTYYIHNYIIYKYMYKYDGFRKIDPHQPQKESRSSSRPRKRRLPWPLDPGWYRSYSEDLKGPPNPDRISRSSLRLPCWLDDLWWLMVSYHLCYQNYPKFDLQKRIPKDFEVGMTFQTLLDGECMERMTDPAAVSVKPS